ncbi:hypothetical protein KYJ26_20295 [Bacillus sp. MCCB 382]|uniref:hypothetical protein n=1 Tax=Bacillus sp. MCCB 382 TaxID=2860197 RepID=UPI001C57E0ED|nr:hypothetical protein [Bacillus sp. MCCB 382]
MLEGDYVYIQYYKYKAYAFIVDTTNERYYKIIKLYREGEDGVKVRYPVIKEESVLVDLLKPVETKIHPEDVKVFIDMSLDSNDKDWFEELMKG